MVPTAADKQTMARTRDLTLSGKLQPCRPGPARLARILDDQLGALRARAGQLEVELGQMLERRPGMHLDLQIAEGARRRFRNAPRPSGYGALAELSQRCLSLRCELARLDAHACDLRDRLSEVKVQLAAFRQLRDGVDPVLDLGARPPGRLGALKETTRRLHGLVDAELDALGAELHAGPIQCLSDVILEAEVLSRELARGEARSGAELRRRLLLAGTMVRGFIDRVRPADTRADALPTALRALARGLRSRGLRVTFTVSGRERPLAQAGVAVVHRVAEVALDNARRHAGVDRASLALGLTADHVSLVVRDDGDGFDVAATEARLGRSRGLGLLTMREHAVFQGGLLDVRSAIGVGTEVRFSLPL